MEKNEASHIITKNGVKGSIFKTIKPDGKDGVIVVFEAYYKKVGIIYLDRNPKTDMHVHWTYVMEKTRFDMDSATLATACSIISDFGYSACIPPGYDKGGLYDPKSSYWDECEEQNNA